MAKIYNSMTELIGNTPILKLNNYTNSLIDFRLSL